MLSASLASASISSLLFAKQLIYGVGWFHLRLGADATMCSSDFLPTLAPGPDQLLNIESYTGVVKSVIILNHAGRKKLFLK